MKAAVIYGTMHKGSTYNCVQLILERLSAGREVTVTEFFLPRDMPHFCQSCYSCFLNGESTCPHNEYIKPIAEALEEAELIILASPVYVFDVSGQMKALLNHFGYQWMPHRPNAGMFSKTGLVVSTAAGRGTGGANKTMEKSLYYWGIQKVFTYGSNVGALKWDDVKPEKKRQITAQTDALVKKIAASRKAKRIRPRLLTRIMFPALKGIQKGNEWNPTDRDYWAKQGWLDGKKPW